MVRTELFYDSNMCLNGSFIYNISTHNISGSELTPQDSSVLYETLGQNVPVPCYINIGQQVELYHLLGGRASTNGSKKHGYTTVGCREKIWKVGKRMKYGICVFTMCLAKLLESIFYLRINLISMSHHSA